jgi:hypothetical protein
MESIKILSDGVNLTALHAHIVASGRLIDASITLGTPTQGSDDLHLTPEAASIIVSGASVLSAVVSSLLLFLANRKAGTITIVGSSGRKLEIPKDMPLNEIETYIEVAHRLDSIRHIVVATSSHDT